MNRSAIIFCAALLSSLSVHAAQEPKSRTMDAVYTASLKDIPAGLKELTVWVPIPATSGHQTVSPPVVESDLRWTEGRENAFGDRFIYTTIKNPPAGEMKVSVRFRATREEATLASLKASSLTKAERQRELQPNRLVTLSPRIRKLADEITIGKKQPLDQARAIYDYLVTSMVYDKVKPGWGQGDSERACDVKAGNCTDFHSLFMSLARAKGIPTRFVIGFPVPAKESGVVTGYHCWAEFFVEGKGWIPVDASEASKSSDPAVRAYLFGNLDPDRIAFTTGRDIVLNPQTAEPLNYFIYPYAEAGGERVGVPSIELKFETVRGTTASGR